MKAERRQLTVMFCDLVESTSMAIRLGAEDFRDVLRAYQEATSVVVDRYEGHVAQLLGDGILVYFGYPRAHAQDAELAVRSALDVLAAISELNERIEPEYGVSLAARIGIHTGRVVVSEMGGAGMKQTLALGHNTHVAARLQEAAEPGSVVVSGATLRLVPGLFITQDLGGPPLKGVRKPIRAYTVLGTTGLQGRVGVDPSRLTPLVGRDRELGLLLERKEHAQEGNGQAVVITGEDGVGKSRLLQALRERLVEEPHTWLECQSTPYARGTAFFPLTEVLALALGFDEQNEVDTKLRRLERAVERAGFSVEDVVPLVAPLLGLPLAERYTPEVLSPELRRKRTIEAIVSWILALAEDQFLVVVFEDIHLSDSSTLEVVRVLLEQSTTSRVLTFLTLGPEFDWQWPRRSHVTHLEVSRLRRRQAARLVSSMSPALPLPQDAIDEIVERADGMPLFLEELTKTVLETGLGGELEGQAVLSAAPEHLSIPTTLQDSLMARLDRLSSAREVAQRIAVLGRAFPYALAAACLDFDEGALRVGLSRLVEADILHQRGEPPKSSYVFKHALLQEAAYDSLLTQTRQQLHGRVVDALLERFTDRVAKAPEMVARHAEAAQRTDIAVEYSRLAGSYAQQRSANEEAAEHFTRALRLLGDERGPERDRVELSLRLALGASLTAVRGYAHPERRRAYERARVLAEALNDTMLQQQALIGLSISECTSGAMESARSLAQQVLTSALEIGDDELALHAHSQLALPEYYQGRFVSSLEHCIHALEFYDPPRHHNTAYLIGGDTGLSAMGVSAWDLWHLGYPDQALARARETVALARVFEDHFGLGFSAVVQGTIHWFRGEFEAQEQVAADAEAVGEKYGFPVWLGLGKVIRVSASVAMGHSASLPELAEGAAIVAETGVQSGVPMLLAMIAATQATAGSFEAALSAVEMGLAVSAATGQACEDAELHRLKGELTISAHRQDSTETLGSAEDSFRTAVQIARAQNARSLELKALTSLARLLLTKGRASEARALLEPAYRWFEEGLETWDLRNARAALDALATTSVEGSAAVAKERIP